MASAATASLEGATRAINACRAPKLDVSLCIEDVAREGNEDRPGGRGRCDLGGAVHDARQVFQARYFDRPLDEWFGHLNHWPVEKRLH